MNFFTMGKDTTVLFIRHHEAEGPGGLFIQGTTFLSLEVHHASPKAKLKSGRNRY